MIAIKIDVEKKDIYEVELEEGLDPIYLELQCDTFACPVTIFNRDTLFVDDDALLKKLETLKGGFFWTQFPVQGIFGSALIIGDDHEGNSVSAKSHIDTIKGQITFMTEAVMKEEYNRLNAIEPTISWRVLS
jgi:hypothetical protein